MNNTLTAALPVDRGGWVINDQGKMIVDWGKNKKSHSEIPRKSNDKIDIPISLVRC
jgi:hypothetical protein